jgi:hypothetical protein
MFIKKLVQKTPTGFEVRIPFIIHIKYESHDDCKRLTIQ